MSLWNRIFGPSEEEVAAGQRADETLDALDRAAWEQGKITTSEYNRRLTARNANRTGTYASQIDGAFDEGWEQGAARVQEATRATIAGAGQVVAGVVGAPVMGILKGVPWWAWILGAGYLAYRFGAIPAAVAWYAGRSRKK